MYRDKDTNTLPSLIWFASLLGEMKALPVYLPELEHYLRDYPDAKSDDITSAFYWENIARTQADFADRSRDHLSRHISGQTSYAVAVNSVRQSPLRHGAGPDGGVKGATSDGFLSDHHQGFDRPVDGFLRKHHPQNCRG